MERKIIHISEHSRAFQRGEETGFNYFFNELYPSLLYFSFRILNNRPTAEEVVEEAFIRIWEMHYSFGHHQVIKSWLYTSIRNASILKLRDIDMDAYNRIMDSEKKGDYQGAPLNNVIITEVITGVHSTIKLLPKGYREIFELFYISNMKIKDVAKKLGMSIDTVAKKKTKGLEILRSRAILSSN
jgi:RNA polymerase sigma factor (sigma-70 family)